MLRDPKSGRAGLLIGSNIGFPIIVFRGQEYQNSRHQPQAQQLPNGYQTVIGSTGVHLSGGERQRIAIARAIVKDAPIIVLDEATAFSDPENEYLIQKAFEKLIQNKTVVMIAHRLSTIRNADQILVMEKGCLIESGTHDELLKKDGKYAQMWSSYTESINWKIGTGKAV